MDANAAKFQPRHPSLQPSAEPFKPLSSFPADRRDNAHPRALRAGAPEFSPSPPTHVSSSPPHLLFSSPVLCANAATFHPRGRSALSLSGQSSPLSSYRPNSNERWDYNIVAPTYGTQATGTYGAPSRSHNLTHAQTNEAGSQRPISAAKLCRFFLQGACRNGKQCNFSHDSKRVNALEGLVTETEKCDEPTAAEYLVEEGITCRFGPGASIVRLVLGEPDASGSASVAISGIPRTCVTEKDVESRLSPFGTLLHLALKDSPGNGATRYAIATFSDKDQAELAVHNLHGSTVKSWFGLVTCGKVMVDNAAVPQTEARLLSSGTISVVLKSDGAIKRPSSVAVSVKVQWYAPSVCAWVRYDQRALAEKVARSLHKQKIMGREIVSKFQLQGCRQCTSFFVWIGNLPCTVTEQTLTKQIKRIIKAPIMSIALSDPPFADECAPNIVRDLLQRFGPLCHFIPGLPERDSVKRKALARFVQEEHAHRACAYFDEHDRIEELGGVKILAQTVFSVKYSLPSRVFLGIRRELDAKFAEIGSARPNYFENRSSWSVSLSGDTKRVLEEALSAARPIFEGEAVRDASNCNRVLWSRRMTSPEFQSAYAKMERTGASSVWVDSRRQEIRVFGPVEERERLKGLILAHFKESALETNAVPISREEFEYLLNNGRGALEKIARAIGAKSVSLDIKNQSLLVESEMHVARKAKGCIARLALGTAAGVRTVLENDCLCPICFCEPDADSPVQLACKHSYCRDCFDAWLDGTNMREYPISCLFDGCQTPVALSDLKRALSGDVLIRLLRTAVDDHARKNPAKLRFCLSPTCPGIFEIVEGERISICSTCAQDICTECNASHGSYSCAEHRLASLPPDRLRMKVVDEILTLRCPRCRQAFLDFTGCFALKCSVCPCGFCGWCLSDCGSDAHSHVLDCSSNPNGKNKSYFGTFSEFFAAQNKNRKKLLTDFLATLPDKDRETCLLSIQKDLADLGIDVE